MAFDTAAIFFLKKQLPVGISRHSRMQRGSLSASAGTECTNKLFVFWGQ